MHSSWVAVEEKQLSYWEGTGKGSFLKEKVEGVWGERWVISREVLKDDGFGQSEENRTTPNGEAENKDWAKQPDRKH